jgi:hypothetical protein
MTEKCKLQQIRKKEKEIRKLEEIQLPKQVGNREMKNK